MDIHSLMSLNQFAGTQLDKVTLTLNQLRELSNRILGLSGTSGLLELTVGSRGGKTFNRCSSIKEAFTWVIDTRWDRQERWAPAHILNTTHSIRSGTRSSGDLDLKQLANELTELRKGLAARAS